MTCIYNDFLYIILKKNVRLCGNMYKIWNYIYCEGSL